MLNVRKTLLSLSERQLKLKLRKLVLEETQLKIDETLGLDGKRLDVIGRFATLIFLGVILLAAVIPPNPGSIVHLGVQFES